MSDFAVSLAAVLTLQVLHDYSDRETAEGVKFDMRWKVAIGRRGQAASLIVLQPRPELSPEIGGMYRDCHIASHRQIARHRKLVLPERAGLSGTACEPPTFPGFGRPVTNQVTTAPGNDRHSAT